MSKKKKDFIAVNNDARDQYIEATKELSDAEFLTGVNRLLGEGCAKRGIDPVWAAEKMVGGTKLLVMFGEFMNEPEEAVDEALEILKEAINEEHNS